MQGSTFSVRCIGSMCPWTTRKNRCLPW